MSKKYFEQQLDLLDSLLNNSNTTLADIQEWLNDTRSKLNTKKQKNKYELTQYDKKIYKEISLFENI